MIVSTAGMASKVNPVTRASTRKLDTLLELESQAKEKWLKEKVFEVEAPRPGDDAPESFYASIPYPYMNGLLHLGHAFTFAKMDFLANYKRLQGKRVLLPIGFHATGMPIKAAADKIKREVELFGKDFKNVVEEEQEIDDEGKDVKSKHSKVSAKSAGKYQYEILVSMGIPIEEVHKFADPIQWLKHFPYVAKDDLIGLGTSIDWRRTAITTEINPYYDSFVKWQLRTMYNSPNKYIFEGTRPTIYSPIDKQPCLDHDRSSGEGIQSQEYICIKLRVLIDKLQNKESKKYSYKDKPVGQELLNNLSLLEGRDLYLVSATLRPETFYAQNACFVSSNITYTVFAAGNNQAYICTHRSGRNMAYQDLLESPDQFRILFTIKGQDLIGLPIVAPMSTKYENIYVLPMETIHQNVGTAIVSSVPSDSPDDLINMRYLAAKYSYFGLHEDWIIPYFDNYPLVIKTKYGNSTASHFIDEYKITSPNDREKIEEIKAIIYKVGFYDATMITGKYSGMSVVDAKPLIKQDLVDEGKAFVYHEPTGKVISRSGDECVVKHCHQWFFNYGEPEWKKKTIECLDNMYFYNQETYNAFRKNLDWLNPWAFGREFGLGTRIPWDPKYVVESLSDSVVHMAYYTVSHFLHKTIDGSVMGSENIPPELVTDKFWNYIFGNSDYSEDMKISKDVLDKLKNEFDYFYPIDVRGSGKDLIFNHLSFSLYVHVAVFPKEKWPKCFFANGHILLNSDKMSKSTGNFLTLKDCLELYGADATRIALAESGDTIDDANFVVKSAEDAILKLHTSLSSAKNLFEIIKSNNARKGEYNEIDKAFLMELHSIVQKTKDAYDNMLMRDCIKYAFYGLSTSFNEYCFIIKSVFPKSNNSTRSELHYDIIKLYLEVFAIINSPICPHISEYIWSFLLGNSTSVRISNWPVVNVSKENIDAHSNLEFIRNLLVKIRSDEEASIRKQSKISKKLSNNNDDASPTISPPNDVSPPQSKTLNIIISPKYPTWCHSIINTLRADWSTTYSDSEKANFDNLFQTANVVKNKDTILFVNNLIQKALVSGIDVLTTDYPVDQYNAIIAYKPFIIRELSYLSINSVEIHTFDAESNELSADAQIVEIFKKKKNAPFPGVPICIVVKDTVPSSA